MTSDDPKKTTLGADERTGIWRVRGKSWPFYAWKDDHWRAYPVDPRCSPRVISVWASGQCDGEITHRRGFTEVADAR